MSWFDRAACPRSPLRRNAFPIHSLRLLAVTGVTALAFAVAPVGASPAQQIRSDVTISDHAFSPAELELTQAA